MELRDAFRKFEEHGIKLYAISSDNQEAIAEFAKMHDVSYKLLSDVDSKVIRQFGILNTQAPPGVPSLKELLPNSTAMNLASLFNVRLHRLLAGALYRGHDVSGVSKLDPSVLGHETSELHFRLGNEEFELLVVNDICKRPSPDVRFHPIPY